MELLVEYLAKGFMVMLAISMPCVLVAAAVGLVVGILQAVTQVQEQTIAAAPKICLVFLSIIILGGFFMKMDLKLNLVLWTVLGFKCHWMKALLMYCRMDFKFFMTNMII